MEEFTRLSRRAPGFSTELLVSFFIGGLREDIRGDVRTHNPKSFYEAFELARSYENRNDGYKRFARSSAQPVRIASSSSIPSQNKFGTSSIYGAKGSSNNAKLELGGTNRGCRLHQ